MNRVTRTETNDVHAYQAKERKLAAALTTVCQLADLNHLSICGVLDTVMESYGQLADHQARQMEIPDYVTDAAAREMQP